MTDGTKPTSARPKVINGVTFRCYHAGILRYEWRSDDGRLVAGSNYNKATYYAIVGVHRLEKRFRSLENAMKAASADYRTS